jgi:glycosyltransferase involved in cell wall biosynthesis
MNNSEKPLKICVVEPRGNGGMIHYAYQLCNGLSMNGADVTLVTSTTYELGDLPHSFKVEKRMRLWDTTQAKSAPSNPFSRLVNKIYKTVRRALRGIRYITEWYRLVHYLPTIKPDLVLFGKIEFPFEAIFLKQLKQKGLLLADICHEFERREMEGSFIENWFNHQYNSAFENFALLFFHAKNNKDRFQELFEISPDKLKIIDHGNEDIFLEFSKNNSNSEDLHTLYQLDETSRVILFFGLLSPSKGIPELITAFSQVVQENKTAKLIIAGYPSKYVNPQDYIDLTAKLGIQENIAFDFRYIPNEIIGDLMNLATVVVYPYNSSTQSGALQVAYTFGKPVIVTNVGGLPEVVDHEKSGLIVPPDHPAELTNAMLTFINNPNQAIKMGEYAKHMSKTRFSWQTITAQIIEEVRAELVTHPQS